MKSPALLAALLAAIAGCGQDAAAPKPVPAKRAVETKTYTLKGIVRAVDAAKGVVKIEHEEIPGFMRSMTMDFTPKDRSNLNEIGPGDEVEGSLEVTSANGAVEDYNLKSLEVTNPAPKTLRIDPASGTMTLAPQPAILRPGEPVPDFAMTTQDGRPLKLSDLRGKVVVLTFIYTSCPLPDFCPAMDKRFRELADALGAVGGRAEAVRLLSVSFDPEHDTPEALRRHAEQVGAKPPLWTFAVASHDELRKVVERLGLVYGPTEKGINHDLCTAVIAPDGRLARLEIGKARNAWTPADMIRTINSYMAGSAK
jgi:protein SCO1/2